MHCDPDFRPLLAAFDVAGLEEHEGTIYGLWPDGRLAYLNPSWFRFAEENGGTEIPRRWALGANVYDAIPADLTAFYRTLLREAEHRPAPARVAPHEYECSSPGEYRRFSMQVLALGSGKGLLVVNSPVLTARPEAVGREPLPPLVEIYADEKGLIRQCSHCRRVARRDDNAWDWVPEWVAASPRDTSHSLCSICLDYHYPAPAGVE
jgi:hypothetical protein